MVNFYNQIINNNNDISIEILNGQVIDKTALNTIMYDCPSSIMPTSSLTVNGKTILQYNCSNLLKLSYLPEKLSFDEYLSLVGGLITFLEECDDWFLDFRSILFDTDYMYYEKKTSTLKLVYLPLENIKATDSQIKKVLSRLIKDYKVTDGEKLQLALVKAIVEPMLSINTLNVVINDYLDRQQQKLLLPTTIDSNPAKLINSNKTIEPVKRESKLIEQQNDLPVNVYEQLKRASINQPIASMPKYSWFSLKKMLRKKKVTKETELSIINNSRNMNSYKAHNDSSKDDSFGSLCTEEESSVPDNNKTEVFSDSSSLLACLKLYRNNQFYSVPEEIQVKFTKNSFTIGRLDTRRGSGQSSFEFPIEAKCVSRYHARFEQHGQELKLIDLYSSNGTYINGVKLAPNMPTFVKQGDKIGFSNQIEYFLILKNN